MYACHIEYEYFGKGDCVDLSTLEDTYYIYPEGAEFSVTKLSLATEELFIHHRSAEADQRNERILESSSSLI